MMYPVFVSKVRAVIAIMIKVIDVMRLQMH